MDRIMKRRLFVAAFGIVISYLVFWSDSTTPAFPRDDDNKLQKAEIRFASQFVGPESLAFDSNGRGPYTGISDGRILRWNGEELGWSDFAYTSPNRSDLCSPVFPPAPNFENEHICGRPLGIRFHPKTGELYIADAYLGLRVVGPQGGYARPIVTEAEGVPLCFTNDVDFGESLIYFTDSSSKYHRRDFVLQFIEGDATGRLLSYDNQTKEVKVLLRDLHFPNGIAVSEDKSFLVMSETLRCRVMRYWLKGPKRGQLEPFASLPGYPDNIRLAEKGGFWVAIHPAPNISLKLPMPLRRALLKLRLPLTSWYTKIAKKLGKGMIIHLSSEGKILEILEDRQGKVVSLVSEVEEMNGKLWLGSVILPHIAVY